MFFYQENKDREKAQLQITKIQTFLRGVSECNSSLTLQRSIKYFFWKKLVN